MDWQDFYDNWHIDAISEHLQAVVEGDIKRLIINIPPRHMKSISVAVALPLGLGQYNHQRDFYLLVMLDHYQLEIVLNAED